MLIVDDNLTQLGSILEFVNWDELKINEIKTASNGRVALDIINGGFLPDIIITDVVMPIVDGVGLQNAVREIYPEIKFIFVSCYDDYDYMKNAIDNNTVAYLLKPLDPDELEEAAVKAISVLESEKKTHLASQIVDESLDLFRENFLCRFLYSPKIDNEYFKKTNSNLGFDKYSSFCLAAMQISVNDANSYRIIEYSKKHIEGITVYHVAEDENKCLFIFMSESDDLSTFAESVKNQLLDFYQRTANECEIYLTIGLSLPCGKLQELPNSLQQANSALEYFISLSTYGLCVYEEQFYTQPNFEITELKEDLLCCLDETTPDKIHSFLDRFYPPNIRQNDVKPLCISIITAIQLILLDHNLDIKDLFGSSAIIYGKLDTINSHYNAKQWLFNIINAAITLIQNTENNRYNKIVKDIKSYIDKNYRDISNISQITDEIHISASYAKNVFKKYTNETIFEYLLTRRMEKAKELLANPYVKIYEVADMVGYKSKAHFSDVFRKYTGCNPSDWQKNLQGEQDA